MSEESRVDRLEVALTNLTEKFTTFIEMEGRRQERDKYQIKINERMLEHIEKVDAEMLPTITRSKKYHEWIGTNLLKIPMAI